MFRSLLCCKRLLTSASRCTHGGLGLPNVRNIKPMPSAVLSLGRPLDDCKSFQAMVHTHAPKLAAKTIKVIDAGKKMEITWNNGETSRFHAVWLRHHCRCVECYCPSSNQRSLHFDELPLEVLILKATLSDSATVQIQWNDNSHIGEFTPAFLQKYCYSQSSLEKKKNSLKTSLYTKPCVPSVMWQDLEEESYVHKWLSDINEHGLSLVKGAPNTIDLMLECIPRHVAPLVNSTYGKIYNAIVEEANPINLSCSRKKLQYHMDMVYYESTPGIQFLHCIRFDESLVGGETVFVDMFAICEEFRRTNPLEFEILCSFPTAFEVSSDTPVNLLIMRPVINLNREKEIIGVYWSPMASSELQIAEEDVLDYCRAKQLFARAISNFHIQ
ncbi:uncharacterized protein LOC110462759 isoform X3 [Mizuhopecten yessoensis]|nr:uncharacterized protein LOC110462759 isoform X3 [Mizuhopecten yessoensis]